MANTKESFDERVAARIGSMSAAEQRVARVFQMHREEVLFASAAALAAKAETSDATVVRTTRSLGFSGMDELRRALAAEMKEHLSPAGRVAATLRSVGGDLQAAFESTLDLNQDSLERLRHDIPAESFRMAVELLVGAKRVVIFGIGPSSAMASYFATQLRRFGLTAGTLTQTGLGSADDLQTLRSGDQLVILAYSRVYRELQILLNEADRLDLRKLLLTDSLGGALRGQVDLVLPVARGRADMFSMHTATLCLIEALLVGVAVQRPEEALQSLQTLDSLRREVAGDEAMNLLAKRDGSGR